MWRITEKAKGVRQLKNREIKKIIKLKFENSLKGTILTENTSLKLNCLNSKAHIKRKWNGQIYLKINEGKVKLYISCKNVRKIIKQCQV